MIRKNLFPIILLCAVMLMIVFFFNQSSALSYETINTPKTTSTVYLPVILHNYDGTLGEPIFGTQVYIDSSNTSPYHTSLLESSATWLRVRIYWSSVEPQRFNPPVYNWSSVDTALAAARTDMGGLKLIVTVESAPSWAADAPMKPIYPDRLDEFAQFTAALAERYDGDGIDDAPGSPVVLHWEMYNEPERYNYWGYAGSQFAQMLQIVYPAIKAANPKAKIVFPGLAYDFFTEQNGPFVKAFLTDVLDAGGGSYVDVMNFHSYPAFNANWTQNKGPGLLEKTQVIRNILAEYNLDMPIIVTEAGWHSNDPPGMSIPGSQQIQARYVVELFTQSMAADLDVMIFWMLYDIPGITFENGLVTNDSPPVKKLSFTTYQKIVEELGTSHFVRQFSQNETGSDLMEVYEFTDNVNQKTIYVAWLNPVDTDVVGQLKINAPGATIRDAITGNVLMNILDSDDGQLDGQITVQIQADPVYVEVDK